MNAKLIEEIKHVTAPDLPHARVYYCDDGNTIIEISDPKLQYLKFNVYGINKKGDTALLYIVPKMLSQGLKDPTYAFWDEMNLNNKMNYEIIGFYEENNNLMQKEFNIKKYESKIKK
jgi:hypothetical protein